MENTLQDVMEYVREEDVRFIRLAFCDLKGNIRNIAIQPNELESAIESGVSFDGSAIEGFEPVSKSDLFLYPDLSTMTVLPWRPTHGRVVRFFCDIRYPDGCAYEMDCRNVLKQAIAYAEDRGIRCNFGTEFEFYLFKLDENGDKTYIPSDNASYMDVAPSDKGENVRREICLTIADMGLTPERSHHEEGPGQNEIDFKYADALASADNAVIFKNATEIIANRNGLWASFEPKPIENESGSGMHINVSVNSDTGEDVFDNFVAGVQAHVQDMTFVLNPTEQSYERLGKLKAPREIYTAREDRSALIRIPANKHGKRMELRSADGLANIYLTFAMIIYAGVEGVDGKYTMQYDTIVGTLPNSLKEARGIARDSALINKYFSKRLLSSIL